MTVEAPPFPPESPTGLTAEDVAGLSPMRLRRLARWHGGVAGNDDGRAWWPKAVRDLPLGLRLGLAEDPLAMAHWTALERRRVDAGPLHFLEQYGHVPGERQGEPPVPFVLWPEAEVAAERCVGAGSQEEVARALLEEGVTAVLKARQLGLTWIALHLAFWTMAFDPDLPRAKVLALSKTEADASELLRRMRRINDLLPPFLRRAEDRESRGSLTRFKLAGRGVARSLVSRPSAARMEQADVFLWDEAAFTINQGFDDTWTAAESTLGQRGRAWIISTGNGDEDTPGDGQGFAYLLGRAMAGEGGMRGVFLPDDVHPARSAEWRAATAKRYRSPLKFAQEHPLCVTGDVRVSTERGILRSDELEGVSTVDGEAVTAYRPQEAAPVMRLTTAAGRIVRGTPDHPVLVEGKGFIEMRDLKPGDDIELRPPRFASRRHVIEWHPVPGFASRLRFDERWARLVGYFVGDGSWYAGGGANALSIVCDAQDEDVVENVRALVGRLLAEPQVRRQGTSNGMEVRLSCKAAREPLVRLGLVHRPPGDSYRRRVAVPDAVWRSPKPVVREFLRGVFEADGSASGRQVRLSSYKEELCRDLQLLLLGFGVTSRVTSQVKRAGDGHEYLSWTVGMRAEEARRFHDEVGFVSRRKRSKRPEASHVGRPPEPIVTVDAVATVEPDGEDVTWVMTVEPSHVFGANGVVTHNTADEALAGVSGEKVYPLEGIAAAERLGRELDALLARGRLRAPSGQSDGHANPGIDWGTHTHMLLTWELEAGGVYVTPVEVAPYNVEVTDKAREFCRQARELVQRQRGPDQWWPLMADPRYDAAGAEQMGTFVRHVEEGGQRPGHPEDPDLRPQWRLRRSQSPQRPLRLGYTRVDFNAWKGRSIDYLTWLFNRTARDEAHGVIAISPRCRGLLRQLRGLEYDDAGKVVKEDDHGPDALVAAVAPIAGANMERAARPDADDEVERKRLEAERRRARRRARAA